MGIHFNADEVFKIGMEVELNGKVFYDEASRVCDSAKLRGILEVLRDQEQAHYETFSKMREDLPSEAAEENVYDPDGQAAAYLKALADSHVFTSETQAADLARQCKDESELLRVALRLEKDTVLMFGTMKDLTRAEWGKAHIDRLIAAEQEHVRQIAGALSAIENLGA